MEKSQNAMGIQRMGTHPISEGSWEGWTVEEQEQGHSR